MIRVKICGITRVQDAVAAAEEGADYVGLIFAKSPRRVPAETARAIVKELPRGVKPVGVFMNQPIGEVRRTLKATGIRIAQLHGSESPRFCRGLGVPFIKTFDRFTHGWIDRLKKYVSFAFLLDVPKGIGAVACRQVNPECVRLAKYEGRVILAGKLTSKNVVERIDRIRPWAVDVASGIEKSPGNKDRSKIRDFIQSARTSMKSNMIVKIGDRRKAES